MLLRKIFQNNKYHLTPRFFVTAPEPLVETNQVANIKTVVDKNHKIKRISDKGDKWESVIGLEVHAQINAKSKAR